MTERTVEQQLEETKSALLTAIKESAENRNTERAENLAQAYAALSAVQEPARDGLRCYSYKDERLKGRR